MGAITNLDQYHDKRQRQIAEVLCAAMDEVLETLHIIGTDPRHIASGSTWPLHEDTCIALVVRKATALHPSLASSPVDRRLMSPILDEIRAAFSDG